MKRSPRFYCLSKSKRKEHGSEVQRLRSRVKQLESQLKYFKKRAHIFETTVEEVVDKYEVKDMSANICPVCGAFVNELDMHLVILKKCTECDYVKRERKK